MGLAAAGVALPASVSAQAVVQPLPPREAADLNDALRRLARSPRDLAHRDRPHPFVFVFAGTMALWAVAAWVVWEFAR